MAAVILRVAGDGQRVQHRSHYRGAFGGEVPGQDPGAAQRGLQPHCPVLEHRARAVIVGGIGRDRAWISAASAARSRRSCRPPAAVTRIASVSRQLPGSWPVQPQMVRAWDSGRSAAAGAAATRG